MKIPLSFGSIQVFILLVIVFVMFFSIFRSLYRQSKNIISSEVLSFPFSTCTQDEFVEIRNKVKTFTEILFKGDNSVEFTINEYELNCLASRGKGLQLYPLKTRNYDHYKLENNSIIWKSLTYPVPGLKDYDITTKLIQISIFNGNLNGLITSIPQNNWDLNFGNRSDKFNGWRLFNDIFYIDRVSELDGIVSKLESMQVQDKSIRFVSKGSAR
jgi:hypothetical protein